MEVHHHSHTARKKWTHYFWEFFMLFLAVTAGFLVENIREHKIEHQREKQYIKTFIADLKSDTMQANLWISVQKDISKGMDSLMAALKAPDAIENPAAINRYFGYAKEDIQFVSASRTMQQLKNSGNMRLIRRASVSDSIVIYDQFLQYLVVRYEEVNSTRKEVLSLLDEIVDENTAVNSDVINREMIPIASPSTILMKDRHKLDILFNKLKRLKEQEMNYSSAMKFVSFLGARLIKLMQKEYHMKD